ncbi:hypothetical protein NQZ68_032181 [Dissostichus eleginoides]|nr:hypothetical protein NQZ68_032181 [Dissostichus eleginoides]
MLLMDAAVVPLFWKALDQLSRLQLMALPAEPAPPPMPDIIEADGYHGGECRFMEASRRPGSHYNVMQPLKTSFAATGTDKMSRYS